MREQSGLTCERDQAQILGVSISTIRRIDGGEQPSAAFIVAFCATYNIGIGEAFEITNLERWEEM